MRRYDLDWLRVLVFSLLIFYHVGMLFVPWDFHLKNNGTYPWLIYPMWFVNQWRLPLLFVISGMGTYYSLQKRSGKKFVAERFVRLYLPLSVGMLFIVPPQVYLERLHLGQFSGSYWQFWPYEAFLGIYPQGNFSWHHLWFLPYLLLVSLILTPVLLYLKKHPANPFILLVRRSLQKPWGWFLFVLPLYLAEAFLEPHFPVSHALIGDWFTLVSSLFLFFFGFVLMAVREIFWPKVVQYRQLFLATGLLAFSLLLGITHLFEDSVLRHYIEALIKVVNLWSWILALFGLAARHLNQNSPTLAYANEAVYPFYILHQSVMMVLAYYLIDMEGGLAWKFPLLVVGTFGFSWLLYEFGIRRWKWLRPLFGLRIKHSRP